MAVLLSATAFAADPAGTWKWTMTPPTGGGGGGNAGGGGGGGGTPREIVLKLASQDGKLSGTITGRQGETAIADAVLKDDTVTFTVSRERNGQTFVMKYTGKIAGDTITGTIEGTGRDGQPTKRDWTATRAKEEAAASPTP